MKDERLEKPTSLILLIILQPLHSISLKRHLKQLRPFILHPSSFILFHEDLHRPVR